jgi:hypothetical protein
VRGEPVKVDYMMRRNGYVWLLSDIYLDGAISEVATRRSEFAVADVRDRSKEVLRPRSLRFRGGAVGTASGRPISPWPPKVPCRELSDRGIVK